MTTIATEKIEELRAKASKTTTGFMMMIWPEELIALLDVAQRAMVPQTQGQADEMEWRYIEGYGMKQMYKHPRASKPQGQALPVAVRYRRAKHWILEWFVSDEDVAKLRADGWEFEPLYARPPAAEADRLDAERLDFMIDRGAFVHKTTTDAGTFAYQVMEQDENEDYHILSGENSFFPTYRAAIDAALAASKEKKE